MPLLSARAPIMSRAAGAAAAVETVKISPQDIDLVTIGDQGEQAIGFAPRWLRMMKVPGWLCHQCAQGGHNVPTCRYIPRTNICNFCQDDPARPCQLCNLCACVNHGIPTQPRAKFQCDGGAASVEADDDAEASSDGSDVSVRAQTGVSEPTTSARQATVVVNGVNDDPAIAGEWL